MSFADGLKAYLAMMTGVMVYRQKPQQECKYPAVAYRLVDERQSVQTNGERKQPTICRYQIDIYGKRIEDISGIARTLHNGLNGYKGMMGTAEVRGCFFLVGTEPNEDEPGIVRISRDYEFTVVEV